jgi:hypothetical protein
MNRALGFVIVSASAAAGCTWTPTRPELVAPADGPPPPRAAAIRPAGMPGQDGPAGTSDISSAAAPKAYVTVTLDGKPAVFDRDTGHWVVRDAVSTSPRFLYTLSPIAGDLRRLLLVVGEYRSGRPEPPIDPLTEMKIVAFTDLPAGTPFALDFPGSGVRVRLASGESVERIRLKPGVEYAVWMQITTSGRMRDGNPWPWPIVRFTTAR